MSFSVNFGTIKPSLNLDFANTKALDPRVTFTRASQGRFYDGVTTAKAEENLLIRSQEFDDAVWNKSNTSVAANSTTAPDGSSTAETLAEAATTAAHALFGAAGTPTRFSVVSGSTYAFSVFLKKGNGATAPDVMQVGYGATGFPATFYANFDLSAGTVTATGAGASSSSILSVGNGWYRCSVVGDANSTTTANTTLAVVFTNNNGSATREPSYEGVTTSDVFVWGAQVEQRSAVTAYTPTTTQPITNYIPVLLAAQAGVPRFDHNPTTGVSLGLLIEEQRTNLVLRSEEFDNAYWTATRITVTPNAVVAPDGTLSADQIIENTDTNTHNVSRVSSITISANTVYTCSVYAKSNGRNIELRFRSASTIGNYVFGVFDLTNGTATTGVVGDGSSNSVTITSVGNGWYRCTLTGKVDSASTTANILNFTSSSGSNSYTGDGYSGIFVWGAQLEDGAFPTSYIPTVASQVTRSADAASMTGVNFSSWFRQDRGTVYTEVDAKTTTFAAFFGNSPGTSNEFYTRVASSGPSFAVVTNGVTQANFGTSALVSKIANAYRVNDFASSVNGGAVATDTLGTLPVVSALGIGATFAPAIAINGTIKKLAFYPERLSDAQLVALTTV
jgi:hypothetical protein